MNIHQNAKTTPRSRAALVQRVQQGAESARDVAEALGVSDRTVRKWVGRYQIEGVAGLADRSCRPHHSPDALPALLLSWIERLRRQRWTGAQIAEALQLSRATVARRLQGLGLARLRALEPAVPVRRSEWKQPGDLLHLDIKKLGRIVKIGHRITGDPRDRVEGAGWEYVHVAIDDHSRAGACHARRRPPSRPRRRRLPRAIHRESPFRCPARHRAPSRSRERRNCSSKRAPGRCWTDHVRGERDQRSKADTYSHAALGRWRRSGRAKSCCQRLEGIGVAASEARDRAC